MRASSPRKRGTRGWKRVTMPAEKMPLIGEQLRECGSVGGDGDPIEAYAHYDNAGRLRRLHARYTNGWRATLVIRLDGGYSLSQAIKLVSAPKDVGGQP